MMPDNIREIDCRTAVRQLWDYLDEELDDQRVDEVRQHLETCKHCLPHADFGERFLQALNGARQRHLMPTAVRSQVMAALAQAGFTAE
jgi:anti-sigma factor (TIGR02949 family)